MSTPAVSPPLVAAPATAAAAGAHAEAPLQILGVHLIGFTAHTAREVLLTVGLVVGFLLINRGLRALNWALFGRRHLARARFWVQQGVAIATTVALVVGLISIWFENPAKLTTAAGLVSAGVAVALQRVITAFAAYLVILRGKVFNIGDRITMAGVRGDVVDLGFIRTTILEMGQAPGEQKDDPSMWVQSRQYTGRLVTVTNDKIFDEPVYNYSRELPFIWEEMHVGVSYSADWRRAERGSRPIKDAMSREIIDRFAEAGLAVASGTYEIVGVPPLRIERLPTERTAAAAQSGDGARAGAAPPQS